MNPPIPCSECDNLDVACSCAKMTLPIAKDAETLVETMAAIEHEQWMEWSKSLASSEPITMTRLNRWKKLWVPYSELSEEAKEQDRVYARQILPLLQSYAAHLVSVMPERHEPQVQLSEYWYGYNNGVESTNSAILKAAGINEG